ncbi:MAG: hypothetical protein ACUVX8_09135, partial [Candidatus Zipacnadales bacterium]
SRFSASLAQTGNSLMGASSVVVSAILNAPFGSYMTYAFIILNLSNPTHTVALTFEFNEEG